MEFELYKERTEEKFPKSIGRTHNCYDLVRFVIFFKLLVLIIHSSNQLIEKIKNDGPERNNFYFSAQISFGALVKTCKQKFRDFC